MGSGEGGPRQGYTLLVSFQDMVAAAQRTGDAVQLCSCAEEAASRLRWWAVGGGGDGKAKREWEWEWEWGGRDEEYGSCCRASSARRGANKRCR